MALAIPQSTTVTSDSSSTDLPRISPASFRISSSQLRFLDNKPTHLKLLNSCKNNSASLKALKEPQNQAQDINNKGQKSTQMMENKPYLFSDMKHRFLRFKTDHYL